MAILYKIVFGTNAIIAIMALVVIGGSAYAIAEFQDATTSFFSLTTYLYFLIAGIVALFIAIIAIRGVTHTSNSGLLFFYYNLILFVVIMMSAGLYTFVTVFDTINGVGADGSVSSAVQQYAAREVQDFVLSAYTGCCEGNVEFCPTVGFNLTEANCTQAVFCPDNTENGGLGQGCYTSSSSIPPFTIPSSFCSFLESSFSPPLVGSPESGSCGGGDPQQFVTNFFAWLNSNYFLILVPMSILYALMMLNFIGACYYNCLPREYKGAPSADVLSI